MNKDSITSKLRNKSKELGINYNVALDQFFFDEFLKLISESKYRENFTLKGGMLLSYTLGIENRTTRDIDFLVSNMSIEADNLNNVLADVLSTNENSDVWFELISNGKSIRLDDFYGGYSFAIVGHLSNMRRRFSIDIATGDPIYPPTKEEIYTTILGDEILLKLYPLETVLSEKIQTILSVAELTSRSKDFYDVYTIVNNSSEKIDYDTLKIALSKTFKYRQTDFNRNEAIDIIHKIGDNEAIKDRWARYRNKNYYVGDIELATILETIEDLIDRLL